MEACDFSGIGDDTKLALKQFQDAQKAMKLDMILSHIHNLYSKGYRFLYRDFHTAVLSNLPANEQVLVASCNHSKDFNKVLARFGEHSEHFNRIFAAASKFCSEYDLVPGFWANADKLLAVNHIRNDDQHMHVHISAEELDKALNDGDLEEVRPVEAILEALVNYSKKHAEMIEEEAEKERKELQRLSQAVRQKRMQKKQVANG